MSGSGQGIGAGGGGFFSHWDRNFGSDFFGSGAAQSRQGAWSGPMHHDPAPHSSGATVPNNSESYSPCYGISNITGLALFVIGIVAAAGVSIPYISWIVIGLSAGSFISNLLAGQLLVLVRRSFVMAHGLQTAVIIALAVLHYLNLLQSSDLGFGIIGTSLSACCCASYMGCNMNPRTSIEPFRTFILHG